MFDRYEFLAQVLKKAGTQAEVGRVIGLPSSRLSELFNPDSPKIRKLKLEEAVILSERFGVPIVPERVSATSLLPVLQVCLRHTPKEWSDAEIRRLAGEIELGLQLRQALEANSENSGGPGQDAEHEAALSRHTLDQARPS